MAIERIEWICPGCRKKFAIPANAPKPAMCPSCQDLAGASVGGAGVQHPMFQRPAAPTPPPVDPSARSAVTRPTSKSNPARPVSATEGGLPDFEAAMQMESAVEALPGFELPDEEGESPTSLTIAAYRKSDFGTLRSFVPVYRALAVMLALCSISALLYAIYAAIALKEAAERMTAIWGSLLVFAGSGLLATLHLVLAELIRLALELEERTRGE